MSFILDALRKSEQERQRSENPGVAAVRMQSAQSYKTVWVVLVAGLVIVNLLLLAFLLLRDAPEPTVATQPAVESTPPTPVSSPGNGLGISAREQTPIANPPQTQDASPSRELRNELSAQAKPVAAPKPAAPSAASGSDKPASLPKESSSISSLPTFTELTLAGSISLPPLHLDIHVYSEKPAERFVFINMRKYREGEQLKEGPAIDTITDEGVVLGHQGRQFLLTRP